MFASNVIHDLQKMRMLQLSHKSGIRMCSYA
jgi:hypothetical protein